MLYSSSKSKVLEIEISSSDIVLFPLNNSSSFLLFLLLLSSFPNLFTDSKIVPKKPLLFILALLSLFPSFILPLTELRLVWFLFS